MKFRIGLLSVLLLFGFNHLESSNSCDDCCTTVTDCCDSDCSTSAKSCSSGTQFGKTFFHLREATQNTPLRMMGNADKMHLFDKGCNIYGVFGAVVGYERTTATCSLGKVFSFDECGTTVFGADSSKPFFDGTIDKVFPNEESNARSADFGLSPSFQASLIFRPRIEKVLIDFDLFVGLDECVCGLWGRIAAPIVHAKYNLNPCQTITTTQGGTYYPSGFVDVPDAVVAVPYDNVKTAWNQLGSYGDVGSSACGKLPCSSKRKTKLGAVSLDLGYDLVRCESMALGISIHGVIPTGNAPRSSYLFDPIAGTYNWQLGGTINAHWTAWCCEKSSISLYGYCVMTHMFKDRQTRLLGLNVGGQTAGNSWIQLKKFDGANVYDGEVVRASSMLGRSIKVGNNFMSDLSFMLQYKRCALDLSLGYNFWYRSKDVCSIKCKDGSTDPCRGGCYGPFSAATYGIKGVSPVAAAGVANDDFYSKADSNIHKSGTLVDAATADATTYVLESDIDTCVALAPSAYSNKIFGYIGYNGDYEDYQPYFGVGGMYEWGQGNRAADQYGVYVKVGVSF
ncbi:hypothetical protein HOM50_04050 [bacterium]|jgi:hypothetical protein|nr:hypothetical protein [bacterium]MBT5015551.1 hypothetical protein [bacterium]